MGVVQWLSVRLETVHKLKAGGDWRVRGERLWS